MVHLVTGYYGYEHIKSADQRAFNAAFFGDGQNVLEFGNKFKASIINNNTVRILDGEGLMFGGHFRIEPNSYEDVTVTTGTAGTNRIDLICVTYKQNEADGTEQTYLEVIEGTAASSPKVPKYTTGNLLNGAIYNQMPLYKVNLEGVVLKSVEPMFTTIPTYKKLAEQYAQQFENDIKAATKMKVLTAMTDLGLEATATFADTVAAVQGYTTVFLQPNSLTDASWNLPISQGYIEITRRYGTRQISVIAYSSLGEMHIATIDTNGVPTGEWVKVTKQKELSAHTANTSNPHSVTKAQVGLGKVTNDKQMPIAGGIFTGAVTLAGDPTSNLQPATKRYVDNRTTYKLLWSNSSATSTFGNQRVTTNDYKRDDYDFFIVLFRYGTSSTTTTSLVVMPNGAMHRVFYFGDIVEGTGLPCIYTRAVTFNSNDIVFGEAYYNYTDSVSSVVDNTRLIPTHIYGVKLH